jgi:hypothetical protein
LSTSSSTPERPRWAVDGNYGHSADLLLPRADTLVWLDYSLPFTLQRVFRRTVRRTFLREIVCNGNRESLFKSFCTRDSIIWWTLTTHARRHRQCEEFMADPRWTHLTRVRLRTPSEAKRWLESLKVA